MVVVWGKFRLFGGIRCALLSPTPLGVFKIEKTLARRTITSAITLKKSFKSHICKILSSTRFKYLNDLKPRDKSYIRAHSLSWLHMDSVQLLDVLEESFRHML